MSRRACLLCSFPLVFSTIACGLLADDPGMMVYDSGIPEIRTRVNEATRTVTFEGFIRFGAVITDWRGAVCANKATS